MSKIRDLEESLKNQHENIDLDKLREHVNNTRFLHDNVVPLINEVVMSAGGKDNYEDAYKSVIDSLRTAHQKVVARLREAETALLKSAGKKELIDQIMPAVTDIRSEEDSRSEERRDKKISEVAEKIESGELNTDRPRKIGTRPESMKTIRMAKATLFGESTLGEESQD